MLNHDQFEKNWQEIKAGFRNVWGRITEDELDQYKDNFPEVKGLVEERYGETREEIDHKFQQLMDSFDNVTDKGIEPDVASYHRSPLEGLQ